MEEVVWSPPELLKMSGNYWSACTLHAGVKLDLFRPLTGKAMASTVLAEQLDLDDRALAMILDALAALGLLEKQQDQYKATAFSTQYLSSDSEHYLGHIIQHHQHLVESWSRMAETVQNGQPARVRVSHESTESERESFLLGMFNLAMMLAPKVVQQVDLSQKSHLLDLGGGPGTYAIHFCQANPQLRATIYDLPETRPIAEKTIKRFNLSSRIDFVSGDFQVDPISGQYDAAWLSHVLHGEGESGCASMLSKTVGALEPGGVLLVQEFILEDSRDRPLFPALFSLNMLLGTPEGKAYSEGEIKSLLEDAGLVGVERLLIELPNGAGIMQGKKPA